jgi:hypothetical protein
VDNLNRLKILHNKFFLIISIEEELHLNPASRGQQSSSESKVQEVGETVSKKFQ